MVGSEEWVQIVSPCRSQVGHDGLSQAKSKSSALIRQSLILDILQFATSQILGGQLGRPPKGLRPGAISPSLWGGTSG